MALTVECPSCGKPVQWVTGNKFKPFCSQRCRTVDLGAWASESYRVAGAPADADTPDHAKPSGEEPC